SDALNRWMDPESNSKILLYTKGSSPTGAFRRLFNISEALQKLKIEVGIALPSISENFSLVIKIHEKVEVYSSDEIPQILGIISAAIEMNGSIESQFYALKALHSKIQLPLQPEKIDDLNHLLSLLGKNEVHIAQSYMDTLKQIRCREDTRWKFFISLDALDTAFNSIKYCNTFSEYEWIVGDSGVQGLHAAPYLFVIRQGEIKAVCLDDLDFQILIKLFNVKANDEPDLSVLSPESLCYSFYPDRARFAIEMIKIVDQSKCHNFDTANLGIPLFKQVPDQRLTETLDIARSALSKNDLNVISSVACIVARNHNDIINLFTKHGWNSAESKFDIKASSEENWKSLYIGLESWLKLKDPFLAK
ncbi:14574_t:CDS:1, partial [Ambispora leptoticha]